MLFYGLAVLGITVLWPYGSVSTLYVILMLSYQWLLGVTMALLGVFFLMYRGYSPSSDLWMAGGILYVVTGGSQIGQVSILLSAYFMPVSFVAAIVGAICFFAKKAQYEESAWCEK
jgi:hypothetical protein